MFDWTGTLIAIGAVVALLVLSYWQAHRPRKDSLRARWVPWNMVMLLCGAALALLLIHVMSLLGYVNPSAPKY